MYQNQPPGGHLHVCLQKHFLSCFIQSSSSALPVVDTDMTTALLWPPLVSTSAAMSPCRAAWTALWTCGPPGPCPMCSHRMYSAPALNLNVWMYTQTRTGCITHSGHSELVFRNTVWLSTDLFILLEDMDSVALRDFSCSLICRNTAALLKPRLSYFQTLFSKSASHRTKYF